MEDLKSTKKKQEIITGSRSLFQNSSKIHITHRVHTKLELSPRFLTFQELPKTFKSFQTQETFKMNDDSS